MTAKAAVASAAAVAERAHAALAALEGKLLALQEVKRATSVRLHELVRGSPAGRAAAAMAMAAAAAPAASSPAAPPAAASPPPPGRASRGGAPAPASPAPPTPPPLGQAASPPPRAPGAAAGAEGAPPPDRFPPASASEKAIAVKKFSAFLAAQDTAVHEASVAWKRGVWEATLASTQVEELRAAQAALSAQLVDVTNDAAGRRNALLTASWRALAVVWAAQVGRLDAARRAARS
jgi:DNA polymerase-3 subunit gamma/tau